MYHFIILIFSIITVCLFNKSISLTYEKLYGAFSLFAMLLIEGINNDIICSILFLLYLITPFLFITKDTYIKLYTALCCLLLLTLNYFLITKYDYFITIYDGFTKSFSMVIPFICCICALWIINSNIYRVTAFCISLVLFCFLAIETFIQNNIFIIYACMEMSFIPMIVMLLSYYKEYDLKIIYKYLFYTLISALFILIGLIGIYNDTGSVMIHDICKKSINNKFAMYILCIGAAIKLPIFPFYYWVPYVHGKSPGVCSVLLSSIVLKFSSLILVKIIFPLFKIYSYQYIGYLVSIGVLVSTIQSLCAKDLKTIIAYASVIHMGIYTFILTFCNNAKYFTYSVLYHTFSMALSFLIWDILKNNYKSLNFTTIKIKNKYEMILLTISTLVTIGFPFTWGFIVETVSILSLVQYDIIIAGIVGLSLLFYTSYLTYINFHVFKNRVIDGTNELNILYTIIIAIILLPIILFGLVPTILL